MDTTIYEYKNFRQWFRQLNTVLSLQRFDGVSSEQIKEFLFTLDTIITEDQHIISTEPAEQINEYLTLTFEDLAKYSRDLYTADPATQQTLREFAHSVWARLERERNGEPIDPVKETTDNLPKIIETVLNFEGDAEAPKKIDMRLGEEYRDSILRDLK